MHAHMIENGKVVNTVVIDSLVDFPDLVPVVGDECIGWGYENGVFIPPPAQPAPPAPPPTVPSSVSRAQGKVALINAGLWPSVLAYVNAIADPTDKALAEVALNDTQEWRRDSLFLNSAATALGLTGAQLDQLFVDASGIVF